METGTKEGGGIPLDIQGIHDRRGEVERRDNEEIKF